MIKTVLVSGSSDNFASKINDCIMDLNSELKDFKLIDIKYQSLFIDTEFSLEYSALIIYSYAGVINE